MSGSLPESFGYKGKSYKFTRFLGSGGVGGVGLYGDPVTGFLVLKVSFCGKSNARELGDAEASNASAAANLGVCTALKEQSKSRTARELLFKDFVRLPISTVFQGSCYFSIYNFYPQNLSEWLSDHPFRTPEQVVAIFLKIHRILICFQSRGFYYNDLKPSNLLVSEKAEELNVLIGDLGGIDRYGDPTVTLTKARLPPADTAGMTWSNIDVLTSFLLGEILFQMILKNPKDDSEGDVMRNFFSCIQQKDVKTCLDVIIAKLPALLARNMDPSSVLVKDLAATALALVGYQDTYISYKEIALTKSNVFL